MSRAIILAAGLGTRLRSTTSDAGEPADAVRAGSERPRAGTPQQEEGREIPKPLREVAGVPLIVRVLRALGQGGVTDVAIVTGHLAELLRDSLVDEPRLPQLHFFHNKEYEKPNGNSVLAAADFVQGPTFLVMSDHLWSPSLLQAVARYPLADHECLLGVDRRIDACFDLDDATKVRVDGDTIVAIDKQLTDYNALDTGVFRITPALIDALRAVDGPGGCSLSDGIRMLAEQGHMKAADTGDATWIDVDTPEAQAEAERLIAKHGDELA